MSVVQRADRKLVVMKVACFIFTALISVSSSIGDDAILIRAKHVLTMEGKILEPGAVLVRDGKIAVVAEGIEAQGAKVVDTEWLMPGLVNAATSFGIAGGTSEISSEVTPDFETSAAIDFQSRDLLEAIDEGITTAHVLPGTQSVFSGYSTIIKTSGSGANHSMPRILLPHHGLTVALSSDPTSFNRARSRPDSVFVRQPTNRMGVVWILRSSFHKTTQNLRASGFDENSQKILQDVLAGKLPVFTVSRKDVDIQSGFQLQDEFGFKPIIVGGDEVYRVMDAILERKPTIIYTAMINAANSRELRGTEGTERRFNVVGQLAVAEIPFCLAGEKLLDQARFATRFGLDRSVALESITSKSAKALQQDKSVGSIAVGKDADLLAFNGDPLEFTSSIQWTMVDGRIIETNTGR